MKNKNHFFSFIIFGFLILQSVTCFAQDRILKLNVRGCAETKVTLIPLAGSNALKSILEKTGIRNGETAIIAVPQDQLPGEFVIRFDYKEKENSTPYPCEKHVFIANQNIELWVNPMYCSNSDSAYFQKEEQENALYKQFTTENAKHKKDVLLLQDFLINYDDVQSVLYKQALKEYDKKRNGYNNWLAEKILKNNTLFVSHVFGFEYVTQIQFNGTEAEKTQSVLNHYFDGIDLTDSLLIHTPQLKKWITSYVNLYGSTIKKETQQDSVFTLAGKTAIEKARKGHPMVYGWMVDYFYNGFESMNITIGIKMLEPYLNDETCLTNKRKAIEKRLKGIKTLVHGSVAPDFMLKNDAGSDIPFSKYKSNTNYKLLLFWSADCSHCKVLVSKLYPWYQQSNNKQLVEVFAMSLDDTSTEIPVWESTIRELPDWKHIRCAGGVNSVEASAYFILSTPVMILIDAGTNTIVATPETVEQLANAINKK